MAKEPILPKGNEQSLSVEVHRAPASSESLYWFGALPAEGKKKIYAADDNYSSQGYNIDLYSRQMELTALQAWKGVHTGGTAQWMGRCEYLQNIPVNGFDFPAFTEKVEPQAINEAMINRVHWPGSVARLSDNRVKEILYSVQQFAIRPKGGLEKSYSKCELVHYLQGHFQGCPGGMLVIGYKGMECPKCKEIEAKIPPTALPTQRRAPGCDSEWRQYGDLPVADFVYLQKLKADVNTPPDEYPTLVDTMERFFVNPPPPLSKELPKVTEPSAVAV